MEFGTQLSTLVVDLDRMTLHEERNGTRSGPTMNIRFVFMTSGKYKHVAYKHVASIIVTCRSLTISEFRDLRAEMIYREGDLADLQIGV